MTWLQLIFASAVFLIGVGWLERMLRISIQNFNMNSHAILEIISRSLDRIQTDLYLQANKRKLGEKE